MRLPKDFPDDFPVQFAVQLSMTMNAIGDQIIVFVVGFVEIDVMHAHDAWRK